MLADLCAALRGSRRVIAPIVVSALLACATGASAQTISTYAGGGVGDGGPAVNAYVREARGSAVDAAGNIYFAEEVGHRVRKVSPAGVISTVAGTGTQGYSGDGGAATAAQLYAPSDVAVDAAGNLYIADEGNHRLRKVTPAGVITTIAGNGSGSHSGDGGPALAAGIDNMQALLVASDGDILFADGSAQRIREVRTNGTIHTIVGNGQSHDGIQSQSGDGGQATAARLANASGLAFDAQGRLLIADSFAGVIRRVEANGVIGTVYGQWGGAGSTAENVAASGARLQNPRDVIFSGGYAYIAENQGWRIRRVGSDGLINTVAGLTGTNHDGGPAISSSVGYVEQLSAHPDGRILVTADGDSTLRAFRVGGNIEKLAGGGFGQGAPLNQLHLDEPGRIALHGDAVIFQGGQRIVRIPATGEATVVASTAEAVQDFAVAPDGTMYVSDLTNGRIWRIRSDGQTDEIAQGQVGVLAVAANGTLYYSTGGFGAKIWKRTPNGTVTHYAGVGTDGFSGDGGPALQAQIGYLGGMTVDAGGNLYLADRGAARIRRIDTAGTITTVVGNGSTDDSGATGAGTSVGTTDLSAMDVDAAGALYFVDGRRVRKLAGGNVGNFAGNGTWGFSGDGGPATAAQFTHIGGVAVASSGRVYLSDEDNDRIRVVVSGAGADLPSAPRNVVGTAGNGAVTVRFNPPEFPGSKPILRYVVEVSPAAGIDHQADTASLSHAITGLVNGQAYTFRVYAVTADGNGARSGASAAVTPNGVLPVATVVAAEFVEGSSSRERSLQVRLNNVSDQPVTLRIDDVAAHGPGYATADGDYTFAAQSLTIPVGQTAATAVFTIHGDAVREPTETFALVLDNLAGATAAGNHGAVAILDGEGIDAPMPLFEGRPDRAYVAENIAADIDVLGNDLFTRSRLTGGSLTIFGAPTHGKATVIATGAAGIADDVIRYTPAKNYDGSDYIVYRVCEAVGRCYDQQLFVVVGNRLPLQESPSERGALVHPRSDMRPLADLRYSLVPATENLRTNVALGTDDNPASPFGGSTAGAAVTFADFPGNVDGQPFEVRLIAHVPADRAAGVDLYVGIDYNRDGQPSLSELRCASAGAGAVAETCEFVERHPGTGVLRAWVVTHNTGTAATASTVWIHKMAVAAAADARFVATGPAKVEAGGEWQLDASWHLPTTLEGDVRAAWLTVTAGGDVVEEGPLLVTRSAAAAAGTRLVAGTPHVAALAPGQAQDRLFVDVPVGAQSLTVAATSAGNVDLYLARDGAPTGPRIGPAPARGAAQASGTGPGNEQLVVSGAGLVPGRWYVTPVNAGAGAIAATLDVQLVSAAPTPRRGSWFNPQRAGHGFFLYPAGAEWAVIWYAYRADGSPTWYYLQAPAPQAGQTWISQVYRSTWDGDSNTLVAIGDASITATGADSMVFTHTVDGVTASEPMQPLGSGCPTHQSAALDISSHWFDPRHAGSGYSVQMFPDYEFYAAFVYDGRGEARYVGAERPSFGGEQAILDVYQAKGFCPSCDPVAVTRTPVGTLLRRMTATSIAEISVDAIYIDGVRGAWSSDDVVELLGGPGTTQGCQP